MDDVSEFRCLTLSAPIAGSTDEYTLLCILSENVTLFEPAESLADMNGLDRLAIGFSLTIFPVESFNGQAVLNIHWLYLDVILSLVGDLAFGFGCCLAIIESFCVSRYSSQAVFAASWYGFFSISGNSRHF